MQANGGLVQHIAHALQIATQLRCQANALRLATAERGRTPIEREVAQAHLFQELKATLDLRNQVTRNATFAGGESTFELQGLHPFAHIGHAQSCDVCNSHAVKAHCACGGIQARALAARADCVMQIFNIGLGKGLLAARGILLFHRIIKHFALVFGEGHTGAHTVGAPAVFAVVAKQARV